MIAFNMNVYGTFKIQLHDAYMYYCSIVSNTYLGIKWGF